MIAPSLIALLEAAYPIGRIHGVAALTGGEWNQVCHLHCDRGAFVLRLSHPTTTATDLAYTHEVIHFINRLLPIVPVPLAAHTSATYLHYDALVATLWPLLPGHMLDRANEAECLAAAKVLARLHQVGLAYPQRGPRPNYPPLHGLDWAHNRLWCWVEVEALLFHEAAVFLRREADPAKRACLGQIFARRTLIAQERTACRDWIAALHASGRALHFGMIHGDYWRNNLLVQRGEIGAILDWDDCQPEWLVYELARATWEFCKDGSQHTLNRPKALRFLQAYQAANGPVPAAEFDLLIPFICCVRLMELLLGLQQALHQGLDEHVLHHLLALENLRGAELVL